MSNQNSNSRNTHLVGHGRNDSPEPVSKTSTSNYVTGGLYLVPETELHDSRATVFQANLHALVTHLEWILDLILYDAHSSTITHLKKCIDFAHKEIALIPTWAKDPFDLFSAADVMAQIALEVLLCDHAPCAAKLFGKDLLQLSYDFIVKSSSDLSCDLLELSRSLQLLIKFLSYNPSLSPHYYSSYELYVLKYRHLSGPQDNKDLVSKASKQLIPILQKFASLRLEHLTYKPSRIAGKARRSFFNLALPGTSTPSFTSSMNGGNANGLQNSSLVPFQSVTATRSVTSSTQTNSQEDSSQGSTSQSSAGPSGAGAQSQVSEAFFLPKRKWFNVWRAKGKANARGMEFTVMSYNILSQVLLESHADLYSSCSNYHLIWKNRSAALLNEILSFESDIVCLQEVEELHWFETFQPILEHFGYQSVFKRRTLQNTDGCAILFKSSKFSLIKSKPVEFCKGGILDRGNIGIVVLLRPKTSVYQGDVEKICIATTHLLFNPKRGDVKLAQLILFLAEIDRYAFCPKTVARQSNLNQSNSTSSNVSKSTGQEEPHPYCPTILCGDFNTEPFSKIYKFITKGQMNYERVLCRIASGQREGFASGGTSLIPRDLIPDWLNITEKCQYFQRPRGSHAEEIDHTRTIANALNYVRGTNSCCVAPGNFQFLGCYQLDQNASPILINPYPSSALHNTSQTHVSPNQPHAHQNTSQTFVNPNQQNAYQNTSQTFVNPNQQNAYQNTSQTLVNPNQQNTYPNTSQTFVNPNQQNTYPNTSQTLVNPNQQNTYQNTSQTLINPNQQNTYQNTSQTLVNPYQQNTYPNTSQTLVNPNQQNTYPNTSQTFVNPNQQNTYPNTSQTLVNPNQQNTYPNTSQTLVNPNQQNTHQNTSQTFVNPNQQNTYQNTSQTFVNPNQQNARQNTSQTLVNPNQPNERQNTSQTFVNPNQPNERQNTSQTFVNPNLPDANENISQTFVNPNLPSGGSSLPSDNGGHSVNSKTNDSVNQVENTMEEQNRYNTGMIYHQFQFKSVYQHDFVINRKKHVEVTTYHKRASCTLDYIFYSSSKFRVPPDGRMLSKHVKDKKSHQDNSDHNQGSPAKRAKDVESESGEGQLMGGKRGQMSQGHTKSGKAKHKGKRKKGKNEESKQTVVIIDDDKVSTGEISQGHNVPSTSRERDVLTAESTNRNENSGNVPNYQDSSKAQTNDNKRSTAANQEGVVLYENHLQLLSRCSLLTEAEIKKIGYMPNMNCPSDHLCLVSKFILH